MKLVLGFFISMLVVSFIGGVTYYMLTRSPGLDAKLCPAGGPTGHTILLVDTTDPLTFTQGQAFAVLFRQLVDRDVPEGQLLSVFVLGEDFKENAEPRIELCNPGNGAGKSELTDSLKHLREQYEDGFIKPLNGVREELVATRSAKYSPILEMLQLVSINGFRKAAVKGDKRLIIVSDMLHNTPQLSMYQTFPDYRAFSETPYGQKTRLDLPGVKVELDYLMNNPTLQTRRNLQFWEELFNKAGARVSAVRPLEG